MLDLAEVLATPLDWRHKGVPPAVAGTPLARVAELGLGLLDPRMCFPLALLKRPALERNAAQMAAFARAQRADLAPHGKTTMAPQLFARQLAAGAWAMTCATFSQLRVYRRFGVPRVIFANPLVGDAEVDWILGELARDPGFEFFSLVDSPAALDALLTGLRRTGLRRAPAVLLEIGAPGARCGVRGAGEAIALARRIRGATPAISLRGIEAFEGVHAGRAPVDAFAAVDRMLAEVREVAAACAAEDLFSPGEVILSAGGSAFFDRVCASLGDAVARPMRLVLRSGCYLTHDDGHYAAWSRAREAGTGPGFAPALEVWGRVLSCPEPGRVVVGAGKRDLSHDLDPPLPQRRARPGDTTPGPLEGLRTVALNDQHAILDGPADHPLRVGDLVGFGISHPCTTFDKWPLLWLVDSRDRIEGAVLTFF